MGLDVMAIRCRKLTDNELEEALKRYKECEDTPDNINYLTDEDLEDLDEYLYRAISGYIVDETVNMPDGEEVGLHLWFNEPVCMLRGDIARDVQTKIHNLSDDYIENTGYYWCDEEMIQVFKDTGKLDPSVSISDENIYYHEWW